MKLILGIIVIILTIGFCAGLAVVNIFTKDDCDHDYDDDSGL